MNLIASKSKTKEYVIKKRKRPEKLLSRSGLHVVVDELVFLEKKLITLCPFFCYFFGFAEQKGKQLSLCTTEGLLIMIVSKSVRRRFAVLHLRYPTDHLSVPLDASYARGTK